LNGPLETINREGVLNLLLEMGVPINQLTAEPEIVYKLHELSEGEPLLLGLYVEDLWQLGTVDKTLTIEDLKHLTPGFAAYFRDWIERQKRIWQLERTEGAEIDEPTMYGYLAILACAYGRLTATDLGEVARRSYGIASRLPTDVALYPLRRFVIGTSAQTCDQHTGYVLSHPKLGVFLQEFLHEHLDPRSIC